MLEVFASIQGEGLYAGEPQTFLRLAGCPLRCTYCDTPGSWTLAERARARLVLPSGDAALSRAGQAAGSARVVHEDSWATPFEAACWIARAEPGTPRTVSVTGGEPLLWPGFIERLHEFLGPRRVHLETAGADLPALARVLDAVDHVSLDLKCALDLAEPVPGPVPSERASAVSPTVESSLPRDAEQWARTRRAALELVRERDACAKLVLLGGRELGDYVALLDEVSELAPRLPVFVQPATAVAGVLAPSRELLEDVAEAALARELVVRVVPQLHRTLRLP